MNIWGILLVIALIVVGVAVYQNGWEGFKADYLGSSIESTKTIYSTGENVVGLFTGNNDTETIDVGKLPCTSNEICNDILSECENQCLCFDDGICRKVGGD